jgi:hypothetical protein
MRNIFFEDVSTQNVAENSFSAERTGFIESIPYLQTCTYAPDDSAHYGTLLTRSDRSYRPVEFFEGSEGPLQNTDTAPEASAPLKTDQDRSQPIPTGNIDIIYHI